MNRKRIRICILISVLALVAAACSNTDSDDTTTTAAPAATTTQAPAATTTQAPAATTTTLADGGEVAFDIGVTEEPCEGGNPDRGCIYLGICPDPSSRHHLR